MYDEIRDELKEKQEELFSWKAQLEISLAEAPKGKLYRSASNGYEQYYIREPDHNGRIRKKYVRKNERKQLAKIWQRDYDCKILSINFWNNFQLVVRKKFMRNFRWNKRRPSVLLY